MDGIDLKRIRGSRSQTEFAAQLGIRVEHLSRLENGRRSVGGLVRARLGLLLVLERLKDNDKPLAVEIRALCEEGLR